MTRLTGISVNRVNALDHAVNDGKWLAGNARASDARGLKRMLISYPSNGRERQ